MSCVVYDCSACNRKTVSPYRESGQPFCAECYEFKLLREARATTRQWKSLNTQQKQDREANRYPTN